MYVHVSEEGGGRKKQGFAKERVERGRGTEGLDPRGWGKKKKKTYPRIRTTRGRGGGVGCVAPSFFVCTLPPCYIARNVGSYECCIHAGRMPAVRQ